MCVCQSSSPNSSHPPHPPPLSPLGVHTKNSVFWVEWSLGSQNQSQFSQSLFYGHSWEGGLLRQEGLQLPECPCAVVRSNHWMQTNRSAGVRTIHRLTTSQPWARIITLCSRSLAIQKIPRSRMREWGQERGFWVVLGQAHPHLFQTELSCTA